MEREVLHVHLLLCHLVLLFKNSSFKWKKKKLRVKKVDFYFDGKLLLEEYTDLKVRVEERVLRRLTSTVSI